MLSLKRSLLLSAALYAASLTCVQAAPAQPIADPAFASDVVDRYANLIFYGSGATGMALAISAYSAALAKRVRATMSTRSWIRWCALPP